MRVSTKGLAVVALIAAAPSAFAGEIAKATCQVIGRMESLELIGDREGHGIIPHTTSCRMESGLLDGGLQTLETLWEWDQTTGALLAASGVVRKPGVIVAFYFTEGKLALTISDGKVTGFTGAGKGRLPLASGTAAPLAGKSFAWTIKSTGAGQFDAVWTDE